MTHDDTNTDDIDASSTDTDDNPGHGEPFPVDLTELRERFNRVLTDIEELVGTIPQEELDAYKRRLELRPDRGLYPDATLLPPEGDGPGIDVEHAHYWATNFHGDHLVDVPHADLPTDDAATLATAGYQLRFANRNGVPLMHGEVIDVGRQDGLGGMTTLIVSAGAETVAADDGNGGGDA